MPKKIEDIQNIYGGHSKRELNESLVHKNK